MIERINQLDTELFLFLNGMHNPFIDQIMYWASDKMFWIPFYLLLFGVIILYFKKRSIYVFIAIALVITLCDQTASNLIKKMVKRLRPSHEPSLQKLIHMSDAGPGGMYGFISSHSANAFGLAIFLILVLPSKFNYLKIIVFLWALLVAYSRIYNGVHYPLDVIVAMIMGLFYGWLVKTGLNWFYFKKINISE